MGRYYYKIEFEICQQEASTAEFNILLQQHISSTLLKRPMFKDAFLDTPNNKLVAEWVILNSSLIPCTHTTKLISELATLAMHLKHNQVATEIRISSMVH
jgi:hypothetical protein